MHDRHKAGTDAYGVRRYDGSGVEDGGPEDGGHTAGPRTWMLLALAGICVLLGGAGCAGGSGSSSITIQPAKGRPKLPPRKAVVQARQDGRLAVAFAAQAAEGGGKVIATIVDPDNVGKDGLDVSFRRGNARRAGTPCGSGCYSAVLPKTGPRAVDVDVAGRTVEFQLPARWPAPDATALVRRASRTYRNLRSIVYAQRLASAPGIEVFSRWQESAPDRFAYRIPGGAAGIAIGSRRWDRTKPSSAWIESTTSPTRMPSPIWGLQHERSRPPHGDAGRATRRDHLPPRALGARLVHDRL